MFIIFVYYIHIKYNVVYQTRNIKLNKILLSIIPSLNEPFLINIEFVKILKL